MLFPLKYYMNFRGDSTVLPVSEIFCMMVRYIGHTLH